jgi:hypothetical protein
MDDGEEMPAAIADSALAKKYQQLKEKNESLEAGNSRELFVAFISGCGVFGLAMIGFRVLVLVKSRSSSASYQQMTGVDGYSSAGSAGRLAGQPSRDEELHSARVEVTEMAAPLMPN